jgi:hypothetical protein
MGSRGPVGSLKSAAGLDDRQFACVTFHRRADIVSEGVLTGNHDPHSIGSSQSWAQQDRNSRISNARNLNRQRLA